MEKKKKQKKKVIYYQFTVSMCEYILCQNVQ